MTKMAETTQSVCIVRSWSYGVGCCCEVNIEFNGKEFRVVLSSVPHVETDEGLLPQRLDAVQQQAGDQEEAGVI